MTNYPARLPMWMDRAECRHHPPMLWMPEPADPGTEGKRICIRGCPVRRECGEYADAVGESHTVMAGFKLSVPEERANLKAWLGAPSPSGPQTCGGTCGLPVRPRRTAVEDHPGTVEVWVKGMCAPCYERARRDRRRRAARRSA